MEGRGAELRNVICQPWEPHCVGRCFQNSNVFISMCRRNLESVRDIRIQHLTSDLVLFYVGGSPKSIGGSFEF